MKKVIVIASGKGGVGKTTTAINLGAAMHHFGKEVLLNLDAKPKVLLILSITLFVVLKFKNSNYHLDNFIPNRRYALYFIIMFLISVINLNKYQIFLYFNF